MVKLLFILTVILLVLGFRKRWVEEFRILTRSEVKASIENLIGSFFVPYAWSERTQLQQEHLELLKNTQAKLPHTLLAKHFIDYKDDIAKKEEEIRNRMKEESQDDLLTFSTLNLSHICASREFKDEELMEFGELLDANFQNSKVEPFQIDIRQIDEAIAILMSCRSEEWDENEKERFQGLVNDCSQTLFTGKPINLEVEISENEGEPKCFHFSSSAEER